MHELTDHSLFVRLGEVLSWQECLGDAIALGLATFMDVLLASVHAIFENWEETICLWFDLGELGG